MKNAYLYDVDAHRREGQAEHQVYYRTHHVYGMLDQPTNQFVNVCACILSSAVFFFFVLIFSKKTCAIVPK